MRYYIYIYHNKRRGARATGGDYLRIRRANGNLFGKKTIIKVVYQTLSRRFVPRHVLCVKRAPAELSCCVFGAHETHFRLPRSVIITRIEIDYCHYFTTAVVRRIQLVPESRAKPRAVGVPIYLNYRGRRDPIIYTLAFVF